MSHQLVIREKHRNAKYTAIRIEELYAKRKRLESIGISNDEQLRAALLEFIRSKIRISLLSCRISIRSTFFLILPVPSFPLASMLI
jgi:hypothetical protein